MGRMVTVGSNETTVIIGGLSRDRKYGASIRAWTIAGPRKENALVFEPGKLQAGKNNN